MSLSPLGVKYDEETFPSIKGSKPKPGEPIDLIVMFYRYWNKDVIVAIMHLSADLVHW